MTKTFTTLQAGSASVTAGTWTTMVAAADISDGLTLYFVQGGNGQVGACIVGQMGGLPYVFAQWNGGSENIQFQIDGSNNLQVNRTGSSGTMRWSSFLLASNTTF